jgi:hypothetical protein
MHNINNLTQWFSNFTLIIMTVNRYGISVSKMTTDIFCLS